MSDRIARIAGAVLIIIVGIWAGARIHSSMGHPGGPVAMRIPVGEASPPTPSDFMGDSAPQPAKIPDHLPQFSLQDLEGTSRSIDTWNGSDLVINFWATWCAPCRKEIPLLEGVAAAWRGRGVQVIGVAVDHRDAVATYAQQMKIEYPILLGEQDALDVATALGFASPVFPFTVFTDRQHDVVALFVGELHDPEIKLILGVVETLDQGRIGLEQARSTIAAGLRKSANNKTG